MGFGDVLDSFCPVCSCSVCKHGEGGARLSRWLRGRLGGPPKWVPFWGPSRSSSPIWGRTTQNIIIFSLFSSNFVCFCLFLHAFSCFLCVSRVWSAHCSSGLCSLFLSNCCLFVVFLSFFMNFLSFFMLFALSGVCPRVCALGLSLFLLVFLHFASIFSCFSPFCIISNGFLLFPRKW